MDQAFHPFPSTIFSRYSKIRPSHKRTHIFLACHGAGVPPWCRCLLHLGHGGGLQCGGVPVMVSTASTVSSVVVAVVMVSSSSVVSVPWPRCRSPVVPPFRCGRSPRCRCLGHGTKTVATASAFTGGRWCGLLGGGLGGVPRSPLVAMVAVCGVWSPVPWWPPFRCGRPWCRWPPRWRCASSVCLHWWRCVVVWSFRPRWPRPPVVWRFLGHGGGVAVCHGLQCLGVSWCASSGVRYRPGFRY